ncbi:MAG: hypothetical protein ACRERD_19795, partial [Candidatus Binatia bacterium]
MAQRADIVVEGVIEELLPATWTTPNGHAPTTVHEEAIKLTQQNPLIQIRTPIRLRVERMFKGETERIGNELGFSVVGGRVGDVAVVNETTLPLFKPGTRIVAFLHIGEPDSPAALAYPSALWPSRFLIVEGAV